MPRVVKTTDVPADPKRLYIYLYCDKLGCYKSATKKKAAKSWLSLSESKRRKFLKMCLLKKDLNNAQRVLSTEPFLKQLHNSAVEDISRENIGDDEHNKSCLRGDNEAENELCLENDNIPQNEPCLDNNNVEQNETCLHKQQQNKTCLNNNNNVQQNELCLDSDKVQQNEPSLCDQEKNKTSLVDDYDRQNNTCLENDNDDSEEPNHLAAIVVNESYLSKNNEKDQQRDIERHLDVNSICKEINGSDAESLSNTEEQKNQETNDHEQDIDANYSKGFINNIKEPIPPTVKNWRELFEILNKGKNIPIQDLSSTDKRTYIVLFERIRKQYIDQYIQYLEGLSDKQLYEHYLKEIN